MLNSEQNDEECDATEVDSSNAVGLIMRRPDFIGISLRSTTGDDPSTSLRAAMLLGSKKTLYNTCCFYLRIFAV
ncbi:MAG: hypothetical protein WDN26_11275 [Chitinophagaceae bacterium]